MLTAAVGSVPILLLVIRAKVHPFVTLLVVSLLVAMAPAFRLIITCRRSLPGAGISHHWYYVGCVGGSNH
ncbi:hypothetical protein BN439_1423 [Erwinia amylovora Ea644]|nr:hypothetical protein BN439_1423 [Erwinia amylovora Ea644]CCP06509.1 hypothetical protein BN440_1467 [Erwinia amylovora MR1]